VKILVVEDNPKVARFLLRALAEEGFVVDGVSDGQTAVRQAHQVHYDLMILDWMLPGFDGLSVCRALRTAGSRLPILMLTARAEVQERIIGLDAGADDYLPKPFDLGEFMARVRALGRRGAQIEETLRIGALRIDRREQRVTLDGRVLDLTRREFKLLAYLGREAGRAVPRTELLARVWEISSDPGSNVVDVHVRNLREKFAEHAHMIETLRGVGYRLVVPS
jgi:DNA-binding response OmpR family regulator